MLSKLQSLLSKLAVTHAATDNSPGQMYSLARHQALAYDREMMAALAPFPEPSTEAPAWGVVMEFGYPGFSATLAAFSNGQTNLYYSDGQGVPHEDVNEQVRQANQKLIAAANKTIPHLKPSASSDLPAPWQAVGKAVGAASIIDTLEEAGLPPHLGEQRLVIDVELDEETALAWMKSFTDLRLALATRLEVEQDDDAYWASLPDDDPRAQAHDIYEWIGALQETLVDAVR